MHLHNSSIRNHVVLASSTIILRLYSMVKPGKIVRGTKCIYYIIDNKLGFVLHQSNERVIVFVASNPAIHSSFNTV